MKLESKYFDSIRVKRRGEAPAAPNPEPIGGCQWKGCNGAGSHRAPMGRGRDGEYLVFCMEHVRQYNASYNYFDGMSDAEIADFQKDALTGHRPTWKVGSAGGSAGAAAEGRRNSDGRVRAADPHDFFAWRARKSRDTPPENRRKALPLERKSLDCLGLSESATREEIKARFKELVKRHHPDANGGDKGSEDKLREIIQAYNYLKQAGSV